MAEIMENRGDIICVDPSERKLKGLYKRGKRLGVTISLPIRSKSDREAPWRGKIFDRILVDAPCSSLGIIRRHPEIKWLRKEEDLKTLADIQKNILEQAAKALLDGGRLLYCTCSLEPEETDDIMKAFMHKHKQFSIVNLKETVPKSWEGMVGEDGALRLMPFSSGVDGFFAFSVTK